MKERSVPVFALDNSANWLDFENALDASVQFQSSERGVILPLFAFAPMTEPDNLDKWEPLKILPQNLMLMSVERHIDARVLKALKRAKPILGETLHAGPAAPVRIDLELPIADVYRQMTEADITAFCETRTGKDDMSF